MTNVQSMTTIICIPDTHYDILIDNYNYSNNNNYNYRKLIIGYCRNVHTLILIKYI